MGELILSDITVMGRGYCVIGLERVGRTDSARCGLSRLGALPGAILSPTSAAIVFGSYPGLARRPPRLTSKTSPVSAWTPRP